MSITIPHDKQGVAIGFYSYCCPTPRELKGEVGAGDTIEQIGKDPNQITITDIVRLYASDREDIETMRRAVRVEALPEGWKHHFLEQIKRVEKNKNSS